MKSTRSVLLAFSVLLLPGCGLFITNGGSSPNPGSSGGGDNIIGPNGSVNLTIPAGYYDGTKTCTVIDTNLIATNIKNGVNLFGITGTYNAFDTAMASTAHRDSGVSLRNFAQSHSNQITLNAENTDYASTVFPIAGAVKYRDIPDMTRDNEGFTGVSCKYASRPQANCGLVQTTTALRIADCAAANPQTSSWNGGTQCNGGEGIWNLVVRNGANKEVWRDSRTGLLWSSLVSTNATWCQASGNRQGGRLHFERAHNHVGAPGAFDPVGNPMVGNGTVSDLESGTGAQSAYVWIQFTSPTTFNVTGEASCASGSFTGTLTATAGSSITWEKVSSGNTVCRFTITQGTVPFAADDTFRLNSVSSMTGCGAAESFCAEGAAYSQTPFAGENWTAGTYSPAKGGMGKNSQPSVAWRLPTINDFKLADVNGIRFVMPDMGLEGSLRPLADDSTGAAVQQEMATYTSKEASATKLSGDIYGFGGWSFDSVGGAVLNQPGSKVRCIGR